MKNLLFGLGLILVLASCEKTASNDDEFVQLMIQQVEKEYEALPELKLLNKGEVSLSTNFKEDGEKITYDGKVVARNVIPLYGSGDVLLVDYDGKGEIVTLYKTEVNHSVMKYDYTLIGIRIKDNIVYTKGYRVDHVMFIKEVLEIDKPGHIYLYGY